MTNGQADAAREAIDRYVTAKQYMNAIEVLDTSPHYNSSNIVLKILPVHLLLGFSLELYFKAWLLGDGMPPGEVRRFGHEIKSLFEECIDRGMSDIPQLEGLVDLAEQGHTRDNNFTFRYFDSRRQYLVMNWHQDRQILSSLDTIVDEKVGASASHGLTPGH